MMTHQQTKVLRGALIVVEGIDRSGKSTQCDLLVKSLNSSGHVAKLMKFPDRTTVIGQMIDSYLKATSDLDDRAIHLLFSANRWEASEGMKRDLNNGTTLVIDRYAFSGVAYSAAKKDMGLEWCKNPDVGLPDPDLVMFLDLDAEKAKRRSGFGGERYEQSKFQNKVYKNFQLLKSEKWRVVDAGRSVDEVNGTMVDLAKKVIASVKENPVGKLWDENKENEL